MAEAKVAFIGGSGLYEMEGLTGIEELEIQTPFGAPSDAIVAGSLEGTSVAFLPRHGRSHGLSPSEIPTRANIYALKSLGVERIVSINAVGSLQEEIKPLDFVVPDQLIDRTKGRVSTFFEGGIVAHVGFANPFCSELADLVTRAARRRSIIVHPRGTCVVIEGPQFSTMAESKLYRHWGASIIGMTTLPEAKLAREAEMCYAAMALVTDYDCWHDTADQVSVELVMSNLLKSIAGSKAVIRELVPTIPAQRQCTCSSALKNAIITNPGLIPKSARERLALIAGKYLKGAKGV